MRPEAMDPSGAEVKCGCELPIVDPWNGILVVWPSMLLAAEPSFSPLHLRF